MRTHLFVVALSALAVSCSGSGSSSRATEPPPRTPVTTGDLSLEVLPASLVLRPGEEGVLVVTLAPTADFSADVTLELSGLPAGASAPAVVVAAGQTTGLLSVRAGAAPSSGASVTVTARAGSLERQASFQLSVETATAVSGAPAFRELVPLDQQGFASPAGVAVDASSGLVHVVSDQGGGLASYDPAQNTLAVVKIPSSHELAVSSTTGKVYAVGGTASLVVVDGGSVTSVPVGGALQGVAIDDASGQIFVAENLYQTVHQLDASTLEVSPDAWRFSSSVDGPVRGPLAVDPERHLVYAGLYGGVGTINAATGEWEVTDLQRVNSTLTQSPADLAVDPRSGTVYALGRDGFNGSDGWIHLMDDSVIPDSSELTATNAATSMALDPGPGLLYVADARNHSVNVFEVASRAFVTQVIVPASGGIDEGPIDVAVDPVTHQAFATFRYYDGVPALAVIDAP